MPSGWAGCIVTIGMFDGVHLGHRCIITRALELGRAAGLPTVVLTFDPHPREVVRPGTHPAVLTTPRYKAALLADLGVDVVCVVPFTVPFSRLSPRRFVESTLVALRPRSVVVGRNFRFGHGQAGDVETLAALGREFGFDTEGVSLVAGHGEEISSSSIRRSVADGDVAAAAEALGRDHRVEGVVVRGDARGRLLGFPTANVETGSYAAIPADGVYAGRLVRLGSGWQGAAAISIGTNPTFAGEERRLEAHVLDFDDDLYGEHVAVSFRERLRDTLAFPGQEALVEQMGRDVAQARALLS